MIPLVVLKGSSVSELSNYVSQKVLCFSFLLSNCMQEVLYLYLFVFSVDICNNCCNL